MAIGFGKENNYIYNAKAFSKVFNNELTPPCGKLTPEKEAIQPIFVVQIENVAT